MSKNKSYLFQGDKVIWIIYFFLCAISIVEVYSSSSSLSYRHGNFWDPVLKHGIILCVGTLLMTLTHNIPCRWFKFYPILLLPLSLVLLIVTLFGKAVNDASRYLEWGGINFQPSELAKGAVVVGTALILSSMQTEKGADKHAFKYILWMTIPICALIFPENFSTAALLFLVVLLMMFIGRVPLLQLGKLLGVLAITVCIGILFIKTIPEESMTGPLHRVKTWKSRIEIFSGNERQEPSPSLYDIEHNSQKAHANIAIAFSNVVGLGPGNSVERDFLSQPYSDFIYSIILEELGIEGGAFVLLLYIILLFRTSRIANRCERNFPAFLAIGLALLMVVQAFINMLVAVGLFPITGQPLPLISRGGTSIFVNCIYIGMILSVSRFAKKRTKTPPEAVPTPAVGETPSIEEEFTNSDGIE